MGERTGRPMASRSDASERQCIVRVATRMHATIRKLHLVGWHVELCRSDALELFAEPHGRDVHRATGRGCEAAGIRTRGDRPGGPCSIQIGDAPHVVGLEPEYL